MSFIVAVLSELFFLVLEIMFRAWMYVRGLEEGGGGNSCTLPESSRVEEPRLPRRK